MISIKNKHQGFTIVELLIVVVIIAILAAITITAYNGIQARARDTIRINDLKQMQRVVELYKAENGVYPAAANGSNWTGLCLTFGSKTTYILGVSNYLPNQPVDPKYKLPSDEKCYLYKSNGTDYMILAWWSMETICGGDPSNACNPTDIQAMDRAAYPEPTIAVYSPGAKNW